MLEPRGSVRMTPDARRRFQQLIPPEIKLAKLKALLLKAISKQQLQHIPTSNSEIHDMFINKTKKPTSTTRVCRNGKVYRVTHTWNDEGDQSTWRSRSGTLKRLFLEEQVTNLTKQPMYAVWTRKTQIRKSSPEIKFETSIVPYANNTKWATRIN